MTDKELNSRIQKGDKTSFRFLFDTYNESLFRYAYKLTLNKEVSEEIVQDIFISIWEKRSERNIDNFQHYLFRAVKNRSINYLKQSVRNLEFVDETIAYINTDKRTPLHLLEANEFSQALEEALLKLPKKCAHIFMLSRNSEMSYKEIADELNISIKTVENQMGIALKKLRELLNNFLIT
ncbi:MAG: RNA polymerase sigma-70 factor [Bacteroidales bacterium]|nr:RNA polymerase sigma-70 factor [Bacteroidales bacterium]